jgi:DNA-binding SARP family transcriptional activator/tetratricopeptide (TPR) repeat protein
MQELRLVVLGRPGVFGDGGRPLSALSRQHKLLALLAYCAIEDRRGWLDADTLCELIWPRAAAPRDALNQAVHHTRKLLGRDVWERSPSGALRLRPDTLWCDVAHLLHGDPDAAWVYHHGTGELLAGLRLAGCPDFDDWLDRQRAAARGRAAAILAAGAGDVDPDTAVSYARRATELDPYSEEAVVALLEAHGARGALSDAWRAFDDYRSRLARDLDMSPPPAVTRTVMRVCRTDDPTAPAPAAAAARTPAPLRPAAGPVSAAGSGIPHDPAPAAGGTGFPGRRHAVTAVVAALTLAVAALGIWWPGSRWLAAEADARPVAEVVLAGGSSAAGMAWDAAVAPALARRLSEGGLQVMRVIGRDGVPAAAPWVVRGTLAEQGETATVGIELHDLRSGLLLAAWQFDGRPDDAAVLGLLTDSVRAALRRDHGADALRHERRAAAAVAALLEARAELEAGRTAVFNQGAGDVGARRLLRADSLAGAASRVEPRWTQPWLLRAEALELRALQAQTRGQSAAAHRLLGDAVTAASEAVRLGAGVPGLELRGGLHYLLWLSDAPAAADHGAAAWQDLEAAVRDGQAGARAWVTLSALYSATGRMADAYAAAQEAVARDPFARRRDDTLMRLFSAAFDAGRDSDARQWCDELALRAPGRAHVAECRLAGLLAADDIGADSLLSFDLDLSREPDAARTAAHTRLELFRVAVLAAHGHDGIAAARLDAVLAALPAGLDVSYPLAAARAGLGQLDLAGDIMKAYLQAGGPVRAGRLHSRWLRPLHDAARSPAGSLAGIAGNRN